MNNHVSSRGGEFGVNTQLSSEMQGTTDSGAPNASLPAASKSAKGEPIFHERSLHDVSSDHILNNLVGRHVFGRGGIQTNVYEECVEYEGVDFDVAQTDAFDGADDTSPRKGEGSQTEISLEGLNLTLASSSLHTSFQLTTYIGASIGLQPCVGFVIRVNGHWFTVRFVDLFSSEE